MPDFSQLLKRPAGVAKRQPPIPAFDYPAICKSWEPTEHPKTHNGIVRIHVGLTGWPDSLPDDVKVDSDGNEIDISNKSFRYDFYVTDAALIILDEFLRSCGIEVPEDGSMNYEELIPQIIGCRCVASVQQALNERVNPPEMYNPPWLKALRGTASA